MLSQILPGIAFEVWQKSNETPRKAAKLPPPSKSDLTQLSRWIAASGRNATRRAYVHDFFEALFGSVPASLLILLAIIPPYISSRLEWIPDSLYLLVALSSMLVFYLLYEHRFGRLAGLFRTVMLVSVALMVTIIETSLVLARLPEQVPLSICVPVFVLGALAGYTPDRIRPTSKASESPSTCNILDPASLEVTGRSLIIKCGQKISEQSHH
jgi:hypothetical protein